MRHSLHHRRRAAESGYAMLIALILLALLSIIGSTSLDIAGIDGRVASHARRHMMLMNAADAGSSHARMVLMQEDPPDEGWDTASVFTFVSSTEANTEFGGVAYPMNLGTYEVEHAYSKCSNPPPGYSTEVSQTGFRSDYWQMTTRSWFEDSAASALNSAEASVMVTLRKVKQGTCKIR